MDSNFAEIGGAIGDGASATTAAPAAGSTTTAPATTLLPETIGVAEFELADLPNLWRLAGSPPEGADVAIYAPSDNNFVAERLLMKALPLDATASTAELVELATNDLEANYSSVSVLSTETAQVGVSGTPAQQIRFNWELPREGGVGWRWVLSADTQLIFVTFLADLSEPNLYLEVVELLLDTANVGG